MALDMHNPFREEPRARPSAPQPQMNPKELFKIYLLGALLVFMLIAMILLQVYSKKQETPPPKLPPDQIKYTIRHATPPTPAAPTPSPTPTPLPPEHVQDRPLTELAREFKDDPDIISNALQKESQEFLAVMRAVRNSVTADQAAQLVNPSLRPDALLSDPAKHRGEWIRVRGRLVNLIPEPLNVTTPENISVIQTGYMLAHPLQCPIHFYLVDPVEGKIERYIKRGQLFAENWVEVEGIFLRLYKYEGATLDESDGPVQIAPVLFAKTCRVIPQPQFQDPRAGFMKIVLAIGGALALVILLAGILARRYGRGTFRSRMLEVRRARAKAEGKPLFPPPSPEKQVLGEETSSPPPSPPPS